jgi:predicted DNA-binding transcriptional regulator AlpA
MEPLLTLEQAGQLVGMTRQQLYELTRSRCRVRMAHPIPYLKLGKCIRFRASSLNEWIQKLEQNATAA